MYPELNGVIAKKGWTKKRLAIEVNIPYTTLVGKLNGLSKFTLDETLIIKQALETDLPIEILFAQKYDI